MGIEPMPRAWEATAWRDFLSLRLTDVISEIAASTALGNKNGEQTCKLPTQHDVWLGQVNRLILTSKSYVA